MRRFSTIQEWRHVSTSCNVADIGTRPAAVAEVMPGCAWQEGYDWMTLPVEDMPLQTAEQITLSAEERRLVAAEVRGGDIRGHVINTVVADVADRYAYSKYLVDPCRLGWSKSLRVLALVPLFITRCKEGGRHRGTAEVDPAAAVVFSQDELQLAADYFFRLGTREFKKFGKLSEVKHCSVEKDQILYFTGRVLDTSSLVATEKVLFDIDPVSFVKPILDKSSPISYSVMIETHWNTAVHSSPLTTYRFSLETAYVVGGRALAQEICESCPFCKRAKARLIEVEMGKVSEERLCIAPAFTIVQVDLFGPYTAKCEHNHRSTVKVWGAVFKCTATGAVAVYVMAYSTDAFIMAYIRFASRYGHPLKLLPDEGSQLLKAVGGHNQHGAIERSIREIQKLFDTVFLCSKYKLDILSFESAFCYVSNEINNFPICQASGFKDLAELDILTPNRLLLGRNNRRSMSGPCTVDSKSRMLESLEAVFQTWWGLWNDIRLADFVSKPPKWFRSSPNLEVGDVVVFTKDGSDQKLGEVVWTVERGGGPAFTG